MYCILSSKCLGEHTKRLSRTLKHLDEPTFLKNSVCIITFVLLLCWSGYYIPILKCCLSIFEQKCNINILAGWKNIQWMWSSSLKSSLCKPQSMTQYPKYRNDHFNWFSVGWVLSHWQSPARSWPLLLQSFGSAAVSCSSPLSTICCGCTFCCAHLPYPRGAHCSRLSHGGLALTSLV